MTYPLARDGRVAAYAAFLTICFVWGTTFVAIRVAIETIPTLLVGGLRFLIAGLILFVIARILGVRFASDPVVLRDQVGSGILMISANLFVVYAEHALSSGLAALLAATIPIWMAIMEAILGRARLTGIKIAGLTLGFGGVGLLVGPEMGRPDVSLQFVLAVLAMQASAICWNSGTLWSRRGAPTGDPMAAAVVQMLSGGVLVTIIAFIVGDRPTMEMFSARSGFAFAYLVIAGSVIGFTAYVFALTRLSAGKVSSYAYVNPAVAVIFGAILLREAVTLPMIAAMIVILAGVATIQMESRIRKALS